MQLRLVLRCEKESKQGTKSGKIVHLDEACKTRGCFLTGFPRRSKLLFRVTRKKERKKERKKFQQEREEN